MKSPLFNWKLPNNLYINLRFNFLMRPAGFEHATYVFVVQES